MKLKITWYSMDMKSKTSIHNFGKRLATLRKSKGLTQTNLANKIGVSRRVVTYYEAESKYPPTHLIMPIAKALKISVDELLGVKKINISDPDNAKLWRKLNKAEKLPQKDQKAVIHYIEALLSKTEK